MGAHANFYNSSNGDRVYDASSFEEWLKPFFKNGVFNGELQVTANNNMAVTVAAGNAYINGRMKCFDAVTSLTLANAHATLNRIDNIVVRRNDADRDFELIVQTGSSAASPAAPTPTRTSTVYDLVIAQVYVPAAAVKITQANITDTRADSSLCGWVASNIEEIPMEQISAQFNAWFEDIREELPGGIVLHTGTPFTVASGTAATANNVQSWDSDGEYLWHIDVTDVTIGTSSAIYNPVFNTAALQILAPYLETGAGYIRLYLNEATTSVAINCLSFEVRY